MLFLCTNYNFSGCVKKGTNIVVLVDSKKSDRQNKKRLRARNAPLPGMLRALNAPRPECSVARNDP